MTAFLTGSRVDSIGYDRNSGRYRNRITGKYESRATILKLVDSEAARLATRMQGHARNLTQNKIDLPQFQQRAAEDLKLSHLRSAMLASGGRSLTTQAQYGSVGRLLREQYSYLDGFARDLAAGKLTPSQAIQRAGLYGASSRSAFYQAEKIARTRENFKEAKRSLDAQSRHCESCLAYDTQGKWLPLQQVIMPTVNCQCMSRCRCLIFFRKRSN